MFTRIRFFLALLICGRSTPPIWRSSREAGFAKEWLESAAVALKDQDVAAVGPKILFAPSFAEIRLDAEAHFAPGDPRPLGRTIVQVAVDGVEVPLDRLRGAGVHCLEDRREGDGPHSWRWTSGAGPIFVPVPEEAKVRPSRSTARRYRLSSAWTSSPTPVATSVATGMAATTDSPSRMAAHSTSRRSASAPPGLR